MIASVVDAAARAHRGAGRRDAARALWSIALIVAALAPIVILTAMTVRGLAAGADEN